MVPRELLLQALVGVVDAQLLKAVGGERLKAVDVKDRDGQATAGGGRVLAAGCAYSHNSHTQPVDLHPNLILAAG